LVFNGSQLSPLIISIFVEFNFPPKVCSKIFSNLFLAINLLLAVDLLLLLLDISSEVTMIVFFSSSVFIFLSFIICGLLADGGI